MDLEEVFQEFQLKKTTVPDILKNILQLLDVSKFSLGKVKEEDITSMDSDSNVIVRCWDGNV